MIDRFAVRTAGTGATASSLSGGNLQKFIVGREIEAGPRVLLVNQPTWGVDVGAAAAIRNELIALRKAGCAILVVSEDLEELFELSDRMFVISQGTALARGASGRDQRAGDRSLDVGSVADVRSVA